MSILLRRGVELHRWQGYRLFGKPPVIAPPAWALAERVWQAADVSPSPERARSGGAFDESIRAAIESVLPVEHVDHVCVVVPDATRVGPWKLALRPLLQALEERSNHRTLLVASGTHAVASSADLIRHLFRAEQVPTEAANWQIMQNGDEGYHAHRAVGETPDGTSVRLHPRYLDAGHRVLLGDVSFHYFAGFGGGPKLVFPGLGTPDAIACNHRRAVDGDPPARWVEACRPGNLSGNPVAEDLRAAVTLAPPSAEIVAVESPLAAPDFAVSEPNPIVFHAGPHPKTHASAIETFAGARRVAFTKAPDLFIADAGGAPRDDSFLQAHKSLQHAVRFVPRNGSILLVARCSSWGSRQIESKARKQRSGSQELGNVPSSPGTTVDAQLHHQSLMALARVVQSRRVGLWSELPAQEVRALGIEPLQDEAEARDWCRARLHASSDGHWGWLPGAERFLPEEGWRGGGLTGADSR